MELTLTADERAFQAEVREGLRAAMPPAIKRKVDLGLHASVQGSARRHTHSKGIDPR